jgi:sulfite exporter TauE/SafE
MGQEGRTPEALPSGLLLPFRLVLREIVTREMQSMSQDLTVLLGSAAAIGLVHTVLGPDHYLPFTALSKARQWSLRKTLSITALCGVGHVLGSVALGLIGIAVGITLRHVELIESHRGEIAAWLLTAFGLVYGTWGVVRAWRNRPHSHVHLHSDGTIHSHKHAHHSEHMHVHEEKMRGATPWILFAIFVFGPCEPLIPLLMYPAVAVSSSAVILVAAVFGLVTIATMMGIVFLTSLGLGFMATSRLSRYGHAMAGAVIFLCGVAIHLGL